MKTTLSFGLMALVAVGLISMRERQQEPTKESVATVRPVETAGPAKTVSPAKTVRPAIAADTIPSGHRFSPLSISINDEGHGRTVTAVATDEKGNTYVLKEVDGKVMEFSINAKLIAKENYSKYVDLFDRIEDYADAPVPPVPAIPAVPPIPAMPAVTPVTAMPAATAMPAVPPMPATPPVPAIPPVPPVPPVSDYYIRHIIRDL
ncbi:hypothetical protein, partial [Puia sp.]|uniref:hypothetical protein n=1 Tax=Puia sp. TaxID=2045100 RepID=UPI002F41F88B